jgi:hypothetical protein
VVPLAIPGKGKQELPLSLMNGGSGTLSITVKVKGVVDRCGITTSPTHLDVPPGQRASLRIDIAAESDQYANLIFEWTSEEGPQNLLLKLFRR